MFGLEGSQIHFAFHARWDIVTDTQLHKYGWTGTWTSFGGSFCTSTAISHKFTFILLKEPNLFRQSNGSSPYGFMLHKIQNFRGDWHLPCRKFSHLAWTKWREFVFSQLCAMRKHECYQYNSWIRRFGQHWWRYQEFRELLEYTLPQSWVNCGMNERKHADLFYWLAPLSVCQSSHPMEKYQDCSGHGHWKERWELLVPLTSLSVALCSIVVFHQLPTLCTSRLVYKYIIRYMFVCGYHQTNLIVGFVLSSWSMNYTNCCWVN